MPAWKNITLNIVKGDLNKMSDSISKINRVLSITIVDRIDEPDSKWFNEDGEIQALDGKSHLIKILISASVSSNALNKEIRTKLNDTSITILKEEIFEDRDWIQHSKNQFREINITDNLTILPPWVAKKNKDNISIIIEPGSGFGTGSHPTTQLCLKWINKNIESNSTMLDYGCGSGILSISANKLGYLDVTGIDNDKQALLNAERNLSLNSAKVNFFHSENYNYEKQYDVTIANILLNSIIKLKDKLISSLKPNGTLILSGILEEQGSKLIEVFSPDIATSIIDRKEGWLLIKGKKD